MNRAFLIIFILFLLIGGIILFAYFYYEKPKQEEIANSFTNINIYATDEGKNIITGYTLEVIAYPIINSMTVEGGAIVEKVPTNSSFKIYNYNLDGQNYYTSFIDKNLYGLYDFQRTELKLEKAEKLNVIKSGNFGVTPVKLEVSSNNYKNLHFCLKWSTHIITVRTNFSETIKPKEYEKYDRCYDTLISLNSTNSSNIILDYKYFSEIDNGDFINIVLYDQDCFNYQCYTAINNTDIGGQNLEISIRK